jgi:uncharacterized membrane protein YraQ (UPF0718 family)
MTAPLAVLGLWVGPALAPLLRRMPPLRAVLDGLILVAIGGLVLLEILPDAIGRAGAWALVAASLGLALPKLAEGALHLSHQRVHRLLLLAAVLGLLVHATSDGAALGLERAEASAALAPTEGDELDHGHGHAHGHAWEEGHGGAALTMAVVMHQVPVGLLLWVSVGVRFGLAAAIAAMALMSAATLLGFFGVIAPLEALGATGAGLLMAFVGGSLLHVVIGHEHEDDERYDTPHAEGVAPAWGGLGALLAVAMIAFTAQLEGDDAHGSAMGTFSMLFVESAPALLVGFLLAGLAHAYLPYASLGWISRGSRLSQAARGVVVGLPLPICSCGVVPLFHSLVRRGVPSAAAIAFLIATPELGIDALLISLPLLGVELTAARLVVALVVALLAGALVSRLVTAPAAGAASAPDATDTIDAPPPPHSSRLKLALRHGMLTSFDSLMPWMVVGLILAALAAPLVDPDWLERLPAGLDVPLCALLGLPVYVCATGATPFVAVLVAKGISPGAAIAFLLTGPATNVTTFGVVSRLWGTRPALGLAAVTVGVTVALGWVANATLPELAWGGVALDAETHEAGWIQLAASALLVGLFFVRVVARGPRALLREVSFRQPGVECGGESTCASSCGDGEGAGADSDHTQVHVHGHDQDFGEAKTGGSGCCGGS